MMNSNSDDHIINYQFEDTISCMKWFPNKEKLILASAGWDNQIRLFNVYLQVNNNNASINSSICLNSSLDSPILGMTWIPEGTPSIVAGLSDGSISLYDINQNRHTQFGRHENGAKEVHFFGNNYNLIVSGGWDHKVCFWDLRTPHSPVLSFDLGSKIFSMSISQNLLIVAMNDRTLTYFNLLKIAGNGFGPELKIESHLKHQTRVVTAFPEGNGYAIGSIEGRVAIKYIDYNARMTENPVNMNTIEDFAFRCHRTGESIPSVYPVHSIAFNPVYGTFCTGGGDGTWMIWDKDSRTRLKQSGFHDKSPITSVDYSFNGDLIAYAGGYDWTKGAQGEKSFPVKIGLHYLNDAEKRKKIKK